MECETVEEELALFNEICIDTDSDSEDYHPQSYSFWKPVPCPPKEPRSRIKRFTDFEKYVADKCDNKIQVLDRNTFYQIKRPIMICFNHFREKCFYLTKHLDTLHQMALKYGDQIVFVVADQMDMDVIYPHRNPITFFCVLIRPETETPHTFIIDEKKRIFQHYDAYHTVETFSETCDKLLDGTLYISQPIPEVNDTRVKIAVHLNFDDLVTKSTNDILLIVGLGPYKKFEEHEPNYEKISKEVRDFNVEIIYIDGDKNYIPFNLNIFGYPSIIFIQHNDKENFVHFSKCPRDTENVLEFIKENIGPEGETLRHAEITKNHFRPFSLPPDNKLEFKDLQQYVNDNFRKSFTVFDRKTFRDLKRCIIIYFMNLEEKGVAFHLETLKKIYQVAEDKHYYSTHFVVADVRDLDIIYPNWYQKYVTNSDTPKVFGIDHLRRIYQAEDFPTVPSLFFFYYQLTYSQLYSTQPCRMTNITDLVTTCVAQNLKILIKNSKKDIFLTLYRPYYNESFHTLKILNEIADDVQKLNVKMFKMDAEHNYVPLEYTYLTYPIHFFIPCRDKDNGTKRYVNSSPSKTDILEFIQTNRLQTE